MTSFLSSSLLHLALALALAVVLALALALALALVGPDLALALARPQTRALYVASQLAAELEALSKREAPAAPISWQPPSNNEARLPAWLTPHLW